MATQSHHSQRPRDSLREDVKVVDLFCGIGGLTHGLEMEGFEVVAGIDNDETCRHAYEKNNAAKFISKDIAHFCSSELKALFGEAKVRVLVGCAPCQPYSSLSRRKLQAYEARRRWYPLFRFLSLIKQTRPEIVSMENVPDLSNVRKYEVFGTFVSTLRKLGYHVSFKTVDTSLYGVPQKRHRLVLLASRLGPLELISETHNAAKRVTVRQAVQHLLPLEAGEADPNDPLHRSSRLSALNKRRIEATPKDGGSAKSWPDELIPECYRRKSGRSFMTTVYGRMRWDDPAPTMTTHCTTLGTGRFGHPSQNRAITLREAAIFQSFPDYYEFGTGSDVSVRRTARHIGNAVPVVIGQVIARSLRRHLEERSVAFGLKIAEN